MPQTQHILLKRFTLFAIPIALVVITVILIFLAPATLYFDFYSLFSPKAVSVNNKSVLWSELKSELDLVSTDKLLKNRQQRLERAIDKSIERQLLRQYLATESANFFGQTPFDEYRHLRKTVEQRLVDRRTGGYFIVTYKPREATESTEVLKKQAKDEITSLQVKLKRGEGFKKVLSDAEKNPVLKKLNFGYFLPGMYLENITEKDFPLKIKSFQEAFFRLKEKEVSEVLTLSWDSYEGPSYEQKVSGEFAYAVAKIEKEDPNTIKDYDEWLQSQKQNAKIQSFVIVPFYFNWLK